MYLTDDTKAYYTSDGSQYTTRGLFLMLVQPEGIQGSSAPIKAVVRKVALRQLGHWMMGKARIYGHNFTVSGAYGGDGLTMDVPQEVYDRLQVELPDSLVEAWNKGGGWNSAGSEAPMIREWALENLDRLRK